MPSAEGETLGQRLHRVRRLPAAEALGVLREASDAPSCAHARGVVHTATHFSRDTRSHNT
jgi:hypothetical protein